MKSKIKILFVLLMTVVGIDCHAAKDEEIVITVTSDGATKDEAIKNTLRMAVEQTYGVYVSSNTDIFNDELVRDEIATISSGNIKHFDEVAINTEPGKVTTTLRVVVSKGKLISYAKSKGAECDFDGAALASDIELKLLYKQNEEEAVENLINEFISQLQHCFDYSIFTDEIDYTDREVRWDYLNGRYDLLRKGTENNGNFVTIPFKVTATLNKNGVKTIARFIEKLSKISTPILSDTKKNNGSERRKDSDFSENRRTEFSGVFVVPFESVEKDKHIRNFYNAVKKYPNIPLRSKKSIEMLNKLFNEQGMRQAGYGSSKINTYLSNFYIDLGSGEQDKSKVKKIGEDGVFMYQIDGNYRFHKEDVVKDEEGEEFYFCFGQICLPMDDLKKLRNIKVVHN